MVTTTLRCIPVVALLTSLVSLAGCDGGEDHGLAVGPGPHGPRVVFEPLLRPTPDVPFPSDLLLLPDESSPSGAVWNISTEESTEHQSRIRSGLNKLDGFGTFAPAFLSFDAPLDLGTVSEASVFLVNIEPGHPRHGELAPLDLGKGHFPAGFTRPGSYFGQDPLAEAAGILFPDTNVADLDGDGTPEPVTHFDFGSNTLIIRPIVPLAQAARHAVLLTRDIKGTDGKSIRSAFETKSHAAQAELVADAITVAGISADDLAFGWTYTTADLTTPLLNARDGVYGVGPLARAADIAPPGIAEIRQNDIPFDNDDELDPRDHDWILQPPFLAEVLSLVGSIQGDSNFALEFPHVDHFVFGSVRTPDLRTGPHKVFGVDLHSGVGEMGTNDVPFMLCVPQETERHQQPFDILFYFHGTGTSRMEAIALCDSASRQGIALLSFDQVGHGPLFHLPTVIEQNRDQEALIRSAPAILARIFAPDRVGEIAAMEFEEAVDELYAIGAFAELAVVGRNEGDVNNNGVLEIAEGFFFADPFRQCAAFWQDLVDFHHLVRTFRGLGDAPAKLADPGSAAYAALEPYLLAGDYDADGVVDAGGPDAQFSSAGTSLGGIHSAMAGALEPEITIVSPIVAGGGITDVMARTDLRFITERIFLDALGSVVVGCPAEDGQVWLSQGNDADRCRTDLEGSSFGVLPALQEGTTVTLTNLVNGEVANVTVTETGGFSLAVPSDPGDELLLEALDASFTAVSKFEGAGYARNSPDFRRIIHVQQHVFDRCDPINFVGHLSRDPLRDFPPTKALFYNALGDDTVPVATSINLALAAGVFGDERAEWEPRIQAYLDAGLFAQSRYDVDDLLGDNPPEEPALGPTPGVAVGDGVSTIRWGDVNGKHEWVAGYEKDGFEAGKHTQHQLTIYHRCGGRLVYDEQPECLQSPECEVLDAVEDLPGCR